MLIPHALWYDDKQVVFKPELSHHSPIYGEGFAGLFLLESPVNPLKSTKRPLAACFHCIFSVKFPIFYLTFLPTSNTVSVWNGGEKFIFHFH